MAVCIRLSRFGRLHRPLFRIVAIDKRFHREGMSNEILGQYDPLKKEKTIQVDIAKVEAWVNRGARISDGLRTLLKHNGFPVPTPAKKPAAAKAAAPAKAKKPEAKKPAGKKGVKQAWVAPSRRSLEQHAAKVKAERKAKAAAEAAAAAAAKAAAAPAAAEAPKT
jgi:small subunit ribosomal protein S16